MANDTATRLLARVKELREARGLSQEAFAEKAGLGYKYYQHVESGRRRDIRLSTIDKLANACGLKLCDLLNFDFEPPISPVDSPTGVTKPPGANGARRSGAARNRSGAKGV